MPQVFTTADVVSVPFKSLTFFFAILDEVQIECVYEDVVLSDMCRNYLNRNVTCH